GRPSTSPSTGSRPTCSTSRAISTTGPSRSSSWSASGRRRSSPGWTPSRPRSLPTWRKPDGDCGPSSVEGREGAWYTPVCLDAGLSNSRTRPDGAAGGALGAWRLGGEPPGGYPYAAVPGEKEEPDRAVQGARGRHRIARGADRAPVGADQRAHRPLQGPPEGPSLASRPVDADRQAPRPARVPAEEGYGALPSRHGKARASQVTAEPDRIGPRLARPTKPALVAVASAAAHAGRHSSRPHRRRTQTV